MVDVKLCDVNDKFGNLFDAVIDYLIFHEMNKGSEWKNLIIVLEEARINAKENKYFNLDKAEDIFAIIKNECDESFITFFEHVITTSNMYFNRMILSYFEENDCNADKNKFLLKLMLFPDLYEEFINVILDNKNLNEELVSVNDCNAKYFIDNGFEIIDAYDTMIGLKNKMLLEKLKGE